MSKEYIFRNGYTIRKEAFYDGYKSNYRWCVFGSDGYLYGSYEEFEKARAVVIGLGG